MNFSIEDYKTEQAKVLQKERLLKAVRILGDVALVAGSAAAGALISDLIGVQDIADTVLLAGTCTAAGAGIAGLLHFPVEG